MVERARADGVPVRAYVSTVCGCPYEGEVRSRRWRSSCAGSFELGADEISLGDTIGVGHPRQVRELVAAVAGEGPLARIALHLHDTYGRALANVQAGYEAGVRTLRRRRSAGLGGCPYAPGASGNVATEDVCDLFEREGIATGVDLERLVDAAAWLERDVLGRPLPGRVYRARMGARERARRRRGPRVKRGEELRARLERIRAGGEPKYHEKARGEGKLFCRERLALLLDAGSFVEDGALANSIAPDLPADGVVTGTGRVAGRPVCVMANDSTVKAGSWGARTVEKILRIQERAERLRVPLVYLVDSAGARITDQIQMFPGRRGAGRIFHNQVRLSGWVPQVCLLFGPSAAGGAYIPAFCDVVFMVEGNASMYLGSPRMAEMVIGQTTTLEEMGGARMHCSVSGCGDLLAKTEDEAIAAAQAYLAYLPPHADAPLPVAPRRARRRRACADLEALIPREENKPFDMRLVIERLIDAGSFFEIKKLFAGELLTGFARIEGHPVGDRREPAEGEGRRAVRRLGRQGRALHLAVRRLRPAAALPGRRAGLHDRQAGRARGHHPRRAPR